MSMEEILPRALELGGTVLIAALLVWRIDTRLASVEKAVNKLAGEIHKLLWKMEKE